MRDKFRVSDEQIPDGNNPYAPPAVDEESADDEEKATSAPTVELGNDENPSSGVEADDEDTDSTKKKTTKKTKDTSDTTEIEDEDVPSSGAKLPQTGVASEKVFYIFGSFLCALGIGIGVFTRRKVKK